MIHIICGTCGTSRGYKSQADGALCLPVSEEARLVARGVASYVTKPIIGTAHGVATPGESQNGGGVGETSPESTPASAGLENGYGDDPSDILDVVDDHFTVESLMQLTRTDMEKLASEMGVDVSKCKNKNEIAALLSEAEACYGVIEDNSEDLPELNAEEPMV